MIKEPKIISREIYKYPYCGKSEIDENENYLSDKVCNTILTISKKTKKKLDWIG